MKKILLSDLLHLVKDAMRDLKMSERSTALYGNSAFAPIKKHYDDHGLKYYSKEVCDDVVLQAWSRHKNGVINIRKFESIRKIAAMLEEYLQTGKLQWGSLPKFEARQLSGYFSSALAAYVKNQETYGRYCRKHYRQLPVLY